MVLYGLLLGLGLLGSAFSKEPEAGTIRLRITNLRNGQGKVRASLYRSAEGFPSDADKAFRTASGDVRQGESVLVFENVPKGEYAIAFIHDENENGKMDTNVLGMPKEGYGASNDAKGRLGPPKYDEARFTVDRSTVNLTVRTNYF